MRECLDDDPNKGDCRTERVAERCIAAPRVPPIETFWREPEARYVLLSGLEGEGRWCDLHNVRSAVLIEKIGAAQTMGERLAIVAVADDAVDRLPGCVGHRAFNLAAVALQSCGCGHTLQRSDLPLSLFSTFALFVTHRAMRMAT